MGSETFPSTGSWQAPAGVTSVTVQLWGGGGTGGPATGTASGAGGGAGGQYVIKICTVIPGNTYTVTVAAVATSATGAVVNGNDSWFDSAAVAIAKGGAGGAQATGATSNGGTGSTAGGIGDTVFAGGSGGNGVSSTQSGGGGGGAGSTGNGGAGSGATAGTGTATGGGDGGAGVSTANTRNNGNSFGGGGSGGLSSSAADRRGGDGGAGQVILTWIDPIAPADDLNNWVDDVQLNLATNNLTLNLSDSLNNWNDLVQKIVSDSVFPVPGVLDSFTRANAADLGANWSGPIQPSTGRNSIVSNQAAADAGGNNSEDYWNVSTFGPDVDVYLTFPTLAVAGDTVRLFARLTDPNTGSVTGYFIEAQIGPPSFVRLRKTVNNIVATIQPGHDTFLTISSGDSLGLRVRGNLLTAYHKVGAGAWTAVNQVSDTAISTAGNVGLTLQGSTVRADEFGAGTLDAGAPLTQSLSDDLNNWNDSIVGSKRDRWQDDLAKTLSGGGETPLTLTLGDDLNNWIDSITGSNRDRWQDTLAKTLNDEGASQINVSASDNMGTLADGSVTLRFDYEIEVTGESFTLGDAVNVSLSSAPTELTLTLADNLAAWLDSIVGSLRDRWQDELNKSLSGGPEQLDLVLGDTLNNWADSLQLGHGLLLTDNADALADSLHLGYGLAVTDDLNTWGDALLLGVGLGFTDSLNLWAESLLLGYGLLITDDANNLADTAAVQTDSPALSLSLSDGLNNWTDSLLLGYGLIVSDDANNWLDTVSVSTGTPALTLTLSDDLNSWADSISTVRSADSLVLADSLNNWLDTVQIQLMSGVDFLSVSKHIASAILTVSNVATSSLITSDTNADTLTTENVDSGQLITQNIGTDP